MSWISIIVTNTIWGALLGFLAVGCVACRDGAHLGNARVNATFREHSSRKFGEELLGKYTALREGASLS
jgi:hypothetical protein